MDISVIGLGKLGLPLVSVLASKGHQVIGLDLNADFVAAINEARVYLKEPSLSEFLFANQERIRATTSYEEAITHSSVTFIVVPTPSDDTGKFTNRFVLNVIHSIGEVLKNKQGYHLIVVTSTLMPGSMDNEIQPCLEQISGRKVGEHLGLCYNPEFIALGSVIEDMLYPDFLLIGQSDNKAGDILEKIYRSVCEKNPPVHRMNYVNAEITKIAVNTFITTKISYANMLSQICARLPGADVDTVTTALGADSRIGSKYIRGAVAYGGPCFPRDNVALAKLAEFIGARADIANATDMVNGYQAERIRRLVEKTQKKNIAVLGLSYKSNTNVVDESQGVKLANELVVTHHHVSVYDPLANDCAKIHLHPSIVICDDIISCIERAEVIIIMTAWDDFKQKLTLETLAKYERKIIIDCWRILSKVELTNAAQVIYLGNGNDYRQLSELAKIKHKQKEEELI